MSALFGREFDVVNPFVRMTKAEVVARIAANGFANLNPDTRSCTRVRDMTILHPHCGGSPRRNVKRRRHLSSGSRAKRIAHTQAPSRPACIQADAKAVAAIHQPQAYDDYLDRLNRAVLDAVNASGEAFLSHTKINGRYAIQLAIGNISSDQADADRAWQLLRYEASRLDDEMRGP
jgi:hypothetical protein